LINLCEFSPNDKWSLLYRGTRDGFGASNFHSKCDGHNNTLTILKSKESSYIFGGYTTVYWESSELPGEYKIDGKAFIFSLTNKDNLPLKMKINSNRQHRAIFCNPELGPIFGSSDIAISNDANSTIDSSSGLGATYKHPLYVYGSNEAKTFLSGSYNFQLDEIEVYKLRN